MPKIITLPGLIDVHTHLREPGATQKEDFETGTKAAIAGGYTVILDMPNNPIPTVTLEALEEKIKLAKGRIYCDLGFNFGASPQSSQYFEQVKNKTFGLKVYMNHTTGDLLMEDESALEDVFSKWSGVIMVHAEGETLEKAISLAKKFQKKLHVCHISRQIEVELVKKARQSGVEISCEVSCHHLFLNEKDGKRLGPFGMMRPPLGSPADQEALWEAVKDGTIDMIASDHAPHTKEEKEKIPAPNGVPGLETSLPLLLTAVSEGRISMDRLIELTSTNPRKIFNIPKQVDTYVEVDPTINYELTTNNLFTKCKWTPFEGMAVVGKITKVVLRGKTVFEDGKISGPSGEVIYPKLDLT